jgi:hypothetical protein
LLQHIASRIQPKVGSNGETFLASVFHGLSFFFGRSGGNTAHQDLFHEIEQGSVGDEVIGGSSMKVIGNLKRQLRVQSEERTAQSRLMQCCTVYLCGSAGNLSQAVALLFLQVPLSPCEPAP